MNATTRPMPPAEGTVGAFPGIAIDDYHADHSAISKSALDDFARSPFRYWSNRFDPNKPAESDKETLARLRGNMLHCALLEPDELQKRHIMLPADAPRRPSITQRNAKNPSPDTIKAIDWWDRFEMDNAGKKMVDADQYDAAWRQAGSLRKIKAIADLMGQGQAEVSEYFIDPITKLWCKIRPDWVRPYDSGDVLLDAKTVGDARPSEFARQVAYQRYHVQDAHYSAGHTLATGRPVLEFMFAIVEPEWPYVANIVMLDEATKAEGRKVARRDLNGIFRHQQTGLWQNTGDNVELVSLPGWAFTPDEEATNG